MSFDSLGLSAELLRAVADQGYTEPTPIQRKAIPVILDGKDVMAGAQTGTGKTAGFTLPLLQRLMQTPAARGRRPVRALVLTPTRELAAQVGESVETYGRHLPMKSAVIFGGVKINPQIQALRRGVDILVATPEAASPEEIQAATQKAERLLATLRQGKIPRTENAWITNVS